MKNPGMSFLLLICGLCVAFTCGLFVGRNINAAPVQISTVTNPPVPTDTSSGSESVGQRININTATALQLEQLPGIGPTLAQKIIDYRDANGPFASVGELLNVSGIGAGRLEDILDLITIGG